MNRKYYFIVFPIFLIIISMVYMSAITVTDDKEQEPVMKMVSGNAMVKINPIETYKNEVIYIEDLDIVMPKPITEFDNIKDDARENKEKKTENKPVSTGHNYYCVVDKGTVYNMDKDWQDYLYDKLANRNHSDAYELAVALAYHESKFNANAISSSGDYGLFQINKCNHSNLSKTLGVTDFLNPYQSIDCGVYMLCNNLDDYDNDFEKALVVYNKGHMISSSTEYSRGVIEDMGKLNII